VFKDVSPRLLVFLTAITWWLAGAFQIFPLGWIALVPFFLLVHELPKGERLKKGYLTGFVSFALINWWIIPTITRGSPAIGAPPVLGFLLGIVAVAIIAAVHGLQVMATAAVARGNSRWLPLQMALVWTFIDWMRSLTIIAHTWGSLGITQTSDWPLLSMGQHALTFLCAFIAFEIGYAIKNKSSWKSLTPAFLVLVWFHAVGYGIRMPFILEFGSDGQPQKLRVLVVQTGASSLSKTQAGRGETPFVQAYRLTLDKIRQNKYDLIIWPETVLQLQKKNEKYSGLNWEILRGLKTNAKLLFGSDTVDENGKRWNEAILLDTDGKTQNYAKRRLVPFGERAPFAEYLPFLGMFAPQPMVEVGQKAPRLSLEYIGDEIRSDETLIRPRICFESCFPTFGEWLELDHQEATEDHSLRAVLTNDEWFTGTEAPRQHRAMAQLRAAEAGQPLIQSANGAFAFFIDSRGRIIETTKNGEPQTLDLTVAVP